MKYTFADYKKITMEKVEKLTSKKAWELRDRIQKKLKEDSEGLFKYIKKYAVNTSANPYHFYSTSPWPELDEKYAKRKGHNNFWFYKGVLSNWLEQTKPSSIYGNPYVEIKNFRQTRRKTEFVFNIRPYPRKNIKLPDMIYNRLSAKTKVRLGENIRYASNEERRPILQLGMQQYINYVLRRRVRKVIEGK